MLRTVEITLLDAALWAAQLLKWSGGHLKYFVRPETLLKASSKKHQSDSIAYGGKPRYRMHHIIKLILDSESQQ